MLGALNTRPTRTEYPEYFEQYVSLVPAGNICEILDRQQDEGRHLAARFGEEQSRFRYAPDKWSVREVFGHLAEVERMLTYWAWCFSRGDVSERPSVDCPAYVAAANFHDRTLESIITELAAVRTATKELFGGLPEQAHSRRGRAAGGELTSLALLYIVAGHERHHLNVLAERYIRTSSTPR